MQLSKASAEKILADMGMDDMPIFAITPQHTPIPADWFTKYKSARIAFMQSLTDAVEELAMMQLSQNEFMDLVMGRSMPRNMSIRFRTPLSWGGEISPENMFMCATFPHSQNLDRFIISQNGNDAIWLPNPVRKIYLPAHTASGGAGGNATEDRLTQLAAQIAADRGMD